MATFFVFRFATLFYLIYALFRDRYSAHNLAIYIFICLTTCVILFLSCLLLFRVVRSDFIAKKADPVKNSNELLGCVTPHHLNSASIIVKRTIQ